jgi:hypothetical protein
MSDRLARNQRSRSPDWPFSMTGFRTNDGWQKLRSEQADYQVAERPTR